MKDPQPARLGDCGTRAPSRTCRLERTIPNLPVGFSHGLVTRWYARKSDAAPQTTGKFTEQKAKDMIAAVTKLLGAL